MIASPSPQRLDKSALLAEVTRFYLESRDFNGMPVPTSDEPDELLASIFKSIALPKAPPRPTFSLEDVKALIAGGLVSLNRGDRHENPHVKAFPPEPIEEQLRKIDTEGLVGCLYPEPKHLTTVVTPTDYAGRPFTLSLALGEPSLAFRVFDLSVLEPYRNDPRYRFEVDDVHGSISVTDKHFEQGTLREQEHAFLQGFGFAYDKDMNRGVAVLLYEMARLTPEQQRLWELRLLTGEYNLHPDFIASTLGHWPDKIPILVAFTEEMRIINEMAQGMGRPPFFRQEFHGQGRPREFMFLLRPTLKAFNEFVHLLDKMLSENINTGFFMGDVPTEKDVPRDDGKIVVERKGSLQILSDWLTQQLRKHDPKPVEEMLATFRKIRKLRQKPAHALNEDEFDQKYFKEQHALVLEAYQAVRTLRLIFANHSGAKSVKVPDDLYRGDIRTI